MFLENYEDVSVEESYELEKDQHGVTGPRLDVTIVNNISEELKEGYDAEKSYDMVKNSIRWDDEELETMLDEVYSAINDEVARVKVDTPEIYRNIGIGRGAERMRSVHDVLTGRNYDGIVEYESEKVLLDSKGDEIIVPDSLEISMSLYRKDSRSTEDMDSRAENLLERLKKIGESY